MTSLMKSLLKNIEERVVKVKMWQWYAIGFVTIFVSGFSLLILRFIAEPVLETTLSAIGYLPGAFWQFAIFGIGTGALGALLVTKILKRFSIYEDKYLRLLLVFSFILVVGIVVIPYTHSLPVLRIIHTAVGWLTALNVVLFMKRVHMVKQFKQKWKNRFLQHMPYVTGLGTIGIFIVSGINLFQEMFFFASMLCWMLIMGVVKE